MNDVPHDFLDTLFADCKGFLELRAISPGKGPAKRSFFDIRNKDAMNGFIHKYRDRHLYYATATRNGRSGRAVDIVNIPVLFADVDNKNGKGDNGKALNDFSLKPSIQIASGTGIHPIWKLNEPATLEDTTRIAALLKKIAAAVNADTAAAEIARCLRIPGTLNYHYDPPKQAKILDFTGNTYELSDFEELLADMPDSITAPAEPTNAHHENEFNFDAYFEQYHVSIHSVKKITSLVDGKQVKGIAYTLKECPWADQHTTESKPGESSIIVSLADDKPRFQCFHDHCTGRTWADFRERISGTDNLKRFMKNTGKEPVYISAPDLLNMEFNEQQPVIDKGILPARASMFLNGESGVGKSLLRSEIAILLAMGWDVYGFPVPTARKTLIIQWENTWKTESVRLRRMLKGHNITHAPNNIIFSDPTLRVNLGLPGDVGKITKYIKDVQPEVVIYDPLSSMHRANENDNIQIRTILDTITHINRETNTAAIVIHHFGKPVDGVQTKWRTRGASSMLDWCDTMLAATDKSHPLRILRRIEFIKVRNGPRPGPILLERDENFVHRITEEGGLCTIAHVRGALKEAGGGLECQKDLIKALKTATGCCEKTARVNIAEAVKLNMVIEKRHGRAKGYELAC